MIATKFVRSGMMSAGLRRLQSVAMSTAGVTYFDRVNKATVRNIREDGKQGTFTFLVPDTFSISKAPNGGFLAAAAIDAAKQLTTFPEPLTISCHYVNKALENVEAVIDVNVLQTAKSSATLDVAMYQEDKLRVKFLVTFGDIARMKGINHNKMTAPEPPPPEDCLAITPELLGFSITNFERIDFRLAKSAPLAEKLVEGKIGTSGLLEGWGRFREPNSTVTTRSLAYFLDAFPPPVLALTTSSWVPTLEYTVHFWNTSTLQNNDYDKWLRVRSTTPFVHNGLLYTNSEVWSEDGTTLLGTSRQLARVL
jgi:acyl-CoA thioesterase